MDFLVSLVGRTLLNLKTFLDGTEMMEDSLYEGQMCYIPEEVKEDKNFVEKIVYVSPIRHAEGNFYLSQILAYPEMYEQMLQVLKEYDEDIISINYDDNERRIGKGTYKILSKSNKKALPLNVYGDGMKKAILLMSAVIAAKDGILLLDEFKTAIHTSAMNKTFKWIIESCKKLNVQVFMTSHSKEATGNWEDALIVLQEERRKCIILVLFIIFSNAIIVFAVGYCMVYSFQKDLIEKNRRNKRKEPKKNLSRKHKYRWKNKDYQLIGWLLIIVAIVFYGAYVNWQGIQNAQKQELFLTTRIDNDTYIVVMTDGDEAILEKDRTGKDGKLKICKDKYMKVDCKNLLLEKKKYRRTIGDGE